MVDARPHLEEEGFVHCSTPGQLAGVLGRYYADHDRDLVLLTIDPDRLASPLVWEVGDPVTGEEFPHVYGPLTPDAVVATRVLHPRTPRPHSRSCCATPESSSRCSRSEPRCAACASVRGMPLPTSCSATRTR